MAIGHAKRRAVVERNKNLRLECLEFMQDQKLRIRVRLDAMESRIRMERNDGFWSRAQLVRECEIRSCR